MKVEIFTDGSSRGNPGPGGYGAILRYVDPQGRVHEKEISQGYSTTTNNRMELRGALHALKELNRPCDVTLYSDSQYLCNAFNQHWVEGWISKGWKNARGAKVKNYDLWQDLLKTMEQHTVNFVWVRGHAGHPENERCDELATAAADGDGCIVDEGYEPESLFS